MIVNDRISRRETREVREHERETIRQALLAELRSARQAANFTAELLREGKETGEDTLHVNVQWETPVFDGLIPHLGLLASEQITPVLNAYTNLRQFDHAVAAFARPDESGHFRLVPATWANTLVNQCKSLLPMLDSAIVALELQ